jgi:hypothetical protein
VSQLARRITEFLLKNQAALASKLNVDPDAAEAAALAHDLGHPPFGHIAEEELHELALAAGALVVIAFHWRTIRSITVWIGAGLGMVSGLSYLLHDPSILGGITEGIAVCLTFLAGAVLFQTIKKHTVSAFQAPLPGIARGLGFGILVAIPLAAVNNLFFYLQNGAPHFQNLLTSAAEALSPGIHEEAVFRYFILAICLALLQNSAHPRLALAAAIIMSVVPHSLLHLPDLFLTNPLMAAGMLVATSLLFGLPMALLQVKRSFETAVAFHWFIDFVRFYFGY